MEFSLNKSVSKNAIVSPFCRQKTFFLFLFGGRGAKMIKGKIEANPVVGRGDGYEHFFVNRNHLHVKHLSHVMTKTVYAICKQQRRRSSAQSDQHLCCLLPG